MKNTKLNNLNMNTHINTLDYKTQNKIKYQLRKVGFFNEDIQLMLSGKLKDIDENINLSEVIN